TVPPNGLLIRFQRTARPTLPCLSVAPITATVRGAKIASSGSRSISGSPPESEDMVGAVKGIMKRDLLFCRSLENEDPRPYSSPDKFCSTRFLRSWQEY